MQNRVEYIDYTKALAIILVVMGHIIFFDIYDGDSQKADTLLIEQILKCVQMPLFIFCSGLVMKQKRISILNVKDDLLKRFRLLVVPFLVIGFFYALVEDKTPIYFLSKGMKLGYWYLLTLFELYILHYLYLFVSRCWENRKIKIIYDLVYGGGNFLVLQFLYKGINPEAECWQNYLSILQLVRYYPYFFAAVLVKKCEVLDKLTENRWLYAISLVLSIMILYMNEHDIHLIGRTLILPIVLIIAVLHMMKLIEKSKCHKTKRILSFIGKCTLDIYLFHYFVISSFRLPFIENILDTNYGWAFSLLLIIPWVIITIGLAVMIGRLIRSSKILNDFIFYR